MSILRDTLVSLEDKVYSAYIRNTGRLRELLLEGNEVYVAKRENGKHPLEIVLARECQNLVRIDLLTLFLHNG